MLVTIKNILESLGILFWLDFGTLLGVAKNNEIMDKNKLMKLLFIFNG